MPTQTFSIRLQDEVVVEIRQRYPEFANTGTKNKGANSDVLRELIGEGLGKDSNQEIVQGLAETKQLLRDLASDVNNQRRNLSVVLELVLRNSGGPKDRVERIIEALQQKGLLA